MFKPMKSRESAEGLVEASARSTPTRNKLFEDTCEGPSPEEPLRRCPPLNPGTDRFLTLVVPFEVEVPALFAFRFTPQFSRPSASACFSRNDRN
jgi:hypothetical protein